MSGYRMEAGHKGDGRKNQHFFPAMELEIYSYIWKYSHPSEILLDVTFPRLASPVFPLLVPPAGVMECSALKIPGHD